MIEDDQFWRKNKRTATCCFLPLGLMVIIFGVISLAQAVMMAYYAKIFTDVFAVIANIMIGLSAFEAACSRQKTSQLLLIYHWICSIVLYITCFSLDLYLINAI